jgi:hypothetical protein
MARHIALAVALATTFSLFEAAGGCTSTSTGAPVPAEAAGPDDGHCGVGPILASSYDRSCTKDSDCVAVGVGDACGPCDLDCPNAAISVGAQAMYLADVAKTPAGTSNGCTVSCAGEVLGPCCRDGQCHADLECSGPVVDAAADTDADAEASACTVDSSEIACCCDGDVGGKGPFCSGGSLSCATGFGLYFGADCNRECGPCAIPCPESGTSEGGGDASHD